ncbi:hypothetical protein C9J12_28620 [Photobacterium frigidiphilum]|uniref:Uncharacterized protein n=1 Tax=Photobacterium frigidiphilum TaxID=264736 RepID=A0A2T3J690_9GAMM|nr:hypothetical protein [Photobacterium frigidiphilum]PSU42863.1 hypothetical protein C9J12_28620 [Photobacterium frigidiphilum]
MSEYQPIVDAIAGLQSNAFKDYFLPIGAIATSALVGFKAAKFAIGHQEDVKAEIGKIKALNRVIMDANAMRVSLLAHKATYFNILPCNPILRVFALKPTVGDFYTPKLDEVDLSFVSSHSTVLTTEFERWSNPMYIHALFTNYKSLKMQWELFHQKRTEIESIIDDYALNQIDRDEMINGIGHPTLMKLTGLAELTINSTDQLLVELTCFCIAFPHFAKELISQEYQEKYGRIIEVRLPTASAIVDLLSLCTPVDYHVMSEIQGDTLAEIKRVYQPAF